MILKKRSVLLKTLFFALSLITLFLFQNFTSSDSSTAVQERPAACDFTSNLDRGDTPADIKTIILTSDEAKVTRQVVSNGKTLSLKAIELDPRCSYKALELQIRSSNLLLDCKGANFDGSVYEKLGSPGDYYSIPGSSGFVKSGSIGIRVYNPSSDETAPALENIFVRNCNFKNYFTGARVQNGYAEILTNDVSKYLSVTGIDKLDFIKDATRIRQEADAIRLHSPHNIEFSNLKIQDSANDGVEIARFVSGVSLTDSLIDNSDGVGVYLNPSSLGNIIKNNTISNNGYKGYVRNGQPKDGISGWLREGIAVDSAPENIISGNNLIGNAGGGIFLYKNCGEYQGWIRPEGSNSNQILGNTFSNMEVGVWTASRQSMNLKTSDCTDSTYYSTDTSAYHLDYAKNTLVSGNTFKDIATAIRIEDDNTEVAKNIFNGNLYTPRFSIDVMKHNFQNFSNISDGKVWGQPVLAGAYYRWKFYADGGWPVQSPNIHDNSSISIYSTTSHPQQGIYVEAYGTKHASLVNNLQACSSNGNVVPSGGILIDYKEEFVTSLANCQGNKRTCVNGALSNYSANYKFGRCVVK